MDDGSPAVHWVVFFVLLLVDIIFYGFGAAVQAINQGAVEKKAEDGDLKSRRLMLLIDNPVGFVNTVQLSVMLVNLILGIYYVNTWKHAIQRFLNLSGGFAAGPLKGLGAEAAAVVSLVLSAALLMYLFLTFGVLAPKRLGAKYSERWAYKLVNVMYYVTKLLSPLTYLITVTTNLFLRLFGIDPNEMEEDVTEEEIISMVNEGHEQGVLQASEAEMITNIFEFSDKQAQDIMTHRKNISAIDGETTLSDALQFMLEGKNSRYPVYEDNIDNIIGIIHLKDTMRKYNDEALRCWKIKDIEGLIMEARFIPETRNIDVLFRGMQSNKVHMVIVVDEYGQTAGLIAMEDILEEIVGNIFDEYDDEESLIQTRDENSYLMSGMTPLDEVEDMLGIEFEEEDFDTLNGLLISRLDKIPEENEQFEMEYQGYSFRIQRVEDKMIKTVLVTKLSGGDGGEAESEKES